MYYNNKQFDWLMVDDVIVQLPTYLCWLLGSHCVSLWEFNSYIMFLCDTLYIRTLRTHHITMIFTRYYTLYSHLSFLKRNRQRYIDRYIVDTCIHTCTYTCIHTYIHSYIHTTYTIYIHSIHTVHIHVYIHTYIVTYTIYIHVYINTIRDFL